MNAEGWRSEGRKERNNSVKKIFSFFSPLLHPSAFIKMVNHD